MKLFIDVHVIQTVPPSCLNRDDTGSPKTAMYGGVRRARVSSQSWKRAMRLKFNESLDAGELSYRTLRVFNLVAKEICNISSAHDDESAMALAKKTLEKVKLKSNASKKESKGSEAKDKNSEDDKLPALFFISSQQAKNLAAVALEDLTDKDDVKKITQALKDNKGIDLALFGRMVADNVNLNSDACAQVAHAISTHRVENEYDYFTAVDDHSEKKDAGAGMIGTVEFNSATLYRYANVAVHELYEQLSSDLSALERALQAFIRAFVLSVPTGKQNTFAAHTLPYVVMVALRADRPLNLADAFEDPVQAKGGFAKPSADALKNQAIKAYSNFCAKPLSSYIVGEDLQELGTRLHIDELASQAAKDAIERIMA